MSLWHRLERGSIPLGSTIMDTKQKEWEEVWKRYDESDPEVRETVVALNLLGINTTASCEGHMTHGESAAWIDVAIENTESFANLNKQADELSEQAEHALMGLDNDHHAHVLMAEYEVVKDLVLKKNLQETVDLAKLLEEFYENRTVNFRVRLVISIYGRGTGRLISQGGIYQKAFDEETQEEYMQEYLEEMKSFGAFLKNKWFEN